MDHDRKNREGGLLVVLFLFILFILTDYVLYNNILFFENDIFYTIVGFFKDIHERIYALRIGYIIFLSAFILLRPRVKAVKNLTKGKKAFYITAALITTALFIYGYTNNGFYNLYIYPGLFILNIDFVTKAITFLTNKLTDESLFGKLSKLTSPYYYVIPSNGDKLHIHEPFTHFWIEGAQRSGKSATFIYRLIHQSIMQGMAGLVYDYEGDPQYTEDGLPILTNLTYTSLKHYNTFRENYYRKKNKSLLHKLIYTKHYPKLVQAFLNFTDFSRTVRINILSRRYIKHITQIRQLTKDLFANLSSDKMNSFWQQYGKVYMNAIIINLWKNYPDYCTLPHAILIAAFDFNKVMKWLMQDEEIHYHASALISAYQNAPETFAGAQVNSQVPFSELIDRGIFYVLSKDDFDLNITHPDNATVFCIGNSPERYQALQPALAAIVSVILRNMNHAGNVPSFVSLDEFPTFKILGMDHLMATARKHRVSIHLALQYYSQAARDYEEKHAKPLRSAGGNIFIGYTRDEQSLKFFSSLFGKIKKKQTSYTTNSESVSTSESMKDEEALKQLDIASQRTGEFTGLVADGKPPYFQARFDEFKMETETIPQFSLPVDTGNEEKNRQIIDSIVDKNYQRIIDEVKTLLK